MEQRNNKGGIMATDLALTIDFGNNSTKISYAYKNNGETYFGKIVNGNSCLFYNFYSIARYKDKKWQFAYDVKKDIFSRSSTIVKIKRLMSLLIKPKDDKTGKIFESNKDYFYNKKLFPKYYFPNPEIKQEDFSKLVNEHTFEADITPNELCAEYFKFVAGVVKKEIAELEFKSGLKFNITLGIVYPLYSGKTYSEQLKNYIVEAFGKNLKCITMESTKGICSMAYYLGLIEKDEKVLVFEIGDERISVVKVAVEIKNQVPLIKIDGRTGHSDPEDKGGNDIDDALGNDVMRAVANRSQMGSNASSDEKMSNDKSFMFADNIQKTKMVISSKEQISKVPLYIPLDVQVTKPYDGNDIKRIIGINNNSGIYNDIKNYIYKELEKEINKDVTKIIISGGGIETFGLFDALKKDIESKHSKVKVRMIEIDKTDKKKYNGKDNNFIRVIDDATFAASTGAAIAIINDYNIYTVFTLSYGMPIIYISLANRPLLLTMYASKGQSIKDGEAHKGFWRFYLGNDKNQEFVINNRTSDSIVSINISSEEIRNHRDAVNTGYDKLLNLTGKDLKNSKNYYGLKPETGGGDGSSYIITYNNTLMGSYEYRYVVQTYIDVYPDGLVEPGISLKKVYLHRNGCGATFLCGMCPRGLIRYDSLCFESISTSGYNVVFKGIEKFKLEE